jgi:hypothetical protein
MKIEGLRQEHIIPCSPRPTPSPSPDPYDALPAAEKERLAREKFAELKVNQASCRIAATAK